MTTGGIKFFQYKQEVAQRSWTIFHGFGVQPMVETNVDTNGLVEKAFPLSIIHLNENTVEITWTDPQKGFASFASVVV